MGKRISCDRCQSVLDIDMVHYVDSGEDHYSLCDKCHALLDQVVEQFISGNMEIDDEEFAFRNEDEKEDQDVEEEDDPDESYDV